MNSWKRNDVRRVTGIMSLFSPPVLAEEKTTAPPKAATKSRFLASPGSARNDRSSRAERGIYFSSLPARNLTMGRTKGRLLRAALIAT
jgi:hypothetical protein